MNCDDISVWTSELVMYYGGHEQFHAGTMCRNAIRSVCARVCVYVRKGDDELLRRCSVASAGAKCALNIQSMWKP